jgi:hypothetical protein
VQRPAALPERLPDPPVSAVRLRQGPWTVAEPELPLSERPSAAAAVSELSWRARSAAAEAEAEAPVLESPRRRSGWLERLFPESAAAFPSESQERRRR